MIGEIRDTESANMAIESALTGHMVLCTLHTNDAPSAITRMSEMGVEPFLIASAVDAVVSQRLARRLCVHCRKETTYQSEYLKKIGFPVDGEEKVTLYRAESGGCPFCSMAGFRGRIGLFEVLGMDEDIEKLIVGMSTARDIGTLAREKGMSTLRQDGYIKVKRGITSIEEVLRVVM
jgi:type IV pilus assembly protein PilB